MPSPEEVLQDQEFWSLSQDARLEVMRRVDTDFAGLSPEAQQGAMQQLQSKFGGAPTSTPSTEDTSSDLLMGLARGVKPALEVGGALFGGAAGGGPTPAGAAMGAGGFALGRTVGNLFERAIGLQKPVETMKDVVDEVVDTSTQAITQYLLDRTITGVIQRGMDKWEAVRELRQAAQSERKILAEIAMDEAGIIPTPADITQSKSARMLEATGAALPPSSKVIEKSALNKLSAYEKFVNKTIQSYNPGTLLESAEVATEQIQAAARAKTGKFVESIGSFASGFGSKAAVEAGENAISMAEVLSKSYRDTVINPAYDKVAALMPEDKIQLEGVAKVADKWIKRIRLGELKKWEKKAIANGSYQTVVDVLEDLGTQPKVEATTKAIGNLVDATGAPLLREVPEIPAKVSNFTIQQAIDKIKFLGELAAQEDVAFATGSKLKFQGNIASGIYKELRATLSNEISGVIEATGNGEFVSAWEDARRKAARAFEIWDTSILRMAKKSPEIWAKPGGPLFKPFNSTVLNKTRMAIGGNAYKELVGAWLREAGDSPEGIKKVLGQFLDETGKVVKDAETFKAIFRTSAEQFQAKNLMRSADATITSVGKIRSLVQNYPEAFVSNVFQNINNFKLAKSNVSPETLSRLKGAWIEKSLGVGKHGLIHPEALSNLLDGMSSEFQKAVFSNTEELKNIIKISEIGNLIKDADKVANIAGGGTQSLIYFGYTSSILWSLLQGDVSKFAGLTGVPYLTAKFYTSPTALKLVKEGLKIPAGTKEATTWLSKVAALSITKATQRDLDESLEE